MDDIAVYLQYLEDNGVEVLFMPWAELVKESNTTEQITDIYNLPGVITRDEMPGWK